MRLRTAIDIYAGGQGSGCNPKVGKCGRSGGLVYHGTAAELAKKIMSEGLRPDNPEYKTFVTTQKDVALMFGLRAVLSKAGDWAYDKTEPSTKQALKKAGDIVLFTVADKGQLESWGKPNPFIKYADVQKTYKTAKSIPASDIVKAEVFSPRQLLKLFKKKKGYGTELVPGSKLGSNPRPKKTIKSSGMAYVVVIPRKAIEAATPGTSGTTAPGSKMLPDDYGMNTVPRNPKKYKLIDSRYGTYINSFDSRDEAYRAMMARPYTKMITGQIPGQYGRAQKAALRKSQKGNPDTDI